MLFEFIVYKRKGKIMTTDKSNENSEKLVWEKPEMSILAVNKLTKGGGGDGDEDFDSGS